MLSLSLISVLVSTTFAQQAAPTATSVAAPTISDSANISAWSDDIWAAARRADMATFEKDIASAPTGTTVSLKALQDAITLRNLHQAEQEKIRQEAVVTRRKEVVDDLAKDNLSKAMVAAANIKFLLDNDAWKLELKTDAVIQLQAKGQAKYLEALKDSDWLLAQEMLFRLRALHEDGGDAAEFKKLTDQLDDCGDRVQLLAEFAPKNLYDLRKKQNDRLKAMEALEPKVEKEAKESDTLSLIHI